MAAQQQQALDLANQARMARAARRREIGALDRVAGLLALAEFVETDAYLDPNLRLVDALRFAKGVGKPRANRLATECLPFSRSMRTLGSLTDRERMLVARRLRQEAGRLGAQGYPSFRPAPTDGFDV
jgi:hypothetical protein